MSPLPNERAKPGGRYHHSSEHSSVSGVDNLELPEIAEAVRADTRKLVGEVERTIGGSKSLSEAALDGETVGQSDRKHW